GVWMEGWEGRGEGLVGGGVGCVICFFFSSRRRHTRLVSDWSSDVCSSDLQRSGQDSETLAAALEMRTLLNTKDQRFKGSKGLEGDGKGVVKGDGEGAGRGGGGRRAEAGSRRAARR